jgi:CheY-like chemotaxis protein
VDLTMPIMNGPEMVRAMRTDPRLAGIPVILMTAFPEAVPTVEAGLHDAVLIKPFGLDTLLDVMDQVTRVR